MRTPESVLDRYVEAVRTLDQEAMLALYSPELRMFDVMAPFELLGPGEFSKRLSQWFGEVTANDPQAIASKVDSKVVGGLAYMAMYMGYYDTDDNGEKRGMTNRLTWVLVPDGDDWKILHEHTSVPISEDDDMTPVWEP